MISLTLYTTQGCHLCTQVEALLGMLANRPVAISHIDISDDDRLVERYGRWIPVVLDSQGEELIKGFEAERLAAWLGVRGWLNERALEALLEETQDSPPKGAYQRSGRRFLG